jgi:hypothetical protein
LALGAARAAEVGNGAVEARVGMDEAAIGQELEAVDGVAVGARVDGTQGLGELGGGRGGRLGEDGADASGHAEHEERGRGVPGGEAVGRAERHDFLRFRPSSATSLRASA